MSKKSQPIARRDFFKTATAAATAGLLVVKPQTAFGSSANSALRLGMVGCGGRGTAVADAFVENTNTHVAALADLFDYRLEETQAHFNKLQQAAGKPGVSKNFKGERAYQDLANSDVDIVLVSTPPYFHPEHLEAALDAGKHVYLEKPVATDVRGCKRVMELASKAEGKLSVDVGFQIRSAPHFAELTRRLHEGAIGDIAFATGFYYAGDLPRRSRPGMSELEHRIRNWFFYRDLSGDVLVEQNVHIIDVFNWVLQVHPEKAQATGGRKVRTDIGDVWDHFAVTYYYPNDVRASFTSTQFLPAWGPVCERFFGAKGFSEAFYSGGLRIIGENPWEAGAEDAPVGTRPEIDPLGPATPEKAKAFVAGIESGKFHNQLKLGAESSLSAILGRQAAYEEKEMTWDGLLKSDQNWDVDLDWAKL
ncbi:MAG: Gfo/Idh/MocA family protein [Acidobacteriota bacterium]